MDRGTTLLQVFQAKLRGWLPVIARSTHAKAEIHAKELGEFEVVVEGTARNGQPWSYSKLFSRELCFGRYYPLSPEAWQVELRPCDHARLLIQEVLQYRGVL